ncbi:MAG TPA: bacillithiol transferase BstA [Acidobacteriaceae bacterium]|nr:bacillithiol transferase BstA [Acidobacteriaceae bacterium]
MAADAMIEAVDPRYPIGRFKRPESVTPDDRLAAIASLAELPANLAAALEALDQDQLGTPYREGGWTVRQLTHHIADSHMNAFIRVRLALTEDTPTIVAYNEKAWAQLADSTAPVSWSSALLQNLHARWVMMLNSLSEEQWQRSFRHPVNGPMTIETATLLYAWHSKHHVAHIARLRERQGW